MRVITLIWLVLLTSCGIFQSQNKIVSVDSTPREVKVLYQKKDKAKEIGKTPLFHEVSKNESGTYTFRYPKKWQLSKTQTKAKTICGYHGDGKVLNIEKGDKSSMNLVNTIDPTSLLGRGKRFECVDVVRANIPEVKKIKQKKCHTYLVIPPQSGHSQFSQRLSKQWREKVFKKAKKDCDKTILPAAAEEFLLFIGIDHIRAPEDLSHMRYKNIFKIAKKFKATHLVFLPYKSDGDKRTVTPKIYDIHKGKIDPLTPNKKYTVTIKQSGFTNFLFSTFRFIPNAVAGRVRTLNKLWARGPDDEQFSKRYDNFDFGISIDNLQYPQREWMLGTQIVPSFVWTNWGKDIDLNTFGLTLDLKLFLHLPPGGVFVFRIGAGGGHINAKSEKYNYNTSTWSYIADTGVEFYFFPLKRFYLNIGYRLYAIDPAKIQLEDVQITGESHLFLELGYFFPELRMLVRNLF